MNPRLDNLALGTKIPLDESIVHFIESSGASESSKPITHEMSKLTFIEHGKLFVDSFPDSCPECKNESIVLQDYTVPGNLNGIISIQQKHCSQCDFEVAWYVARGKRIHIFPTAADAGKWARRYGKR